MEYKYDTFMDIHKLVKACFRSVSKKDLQLYEKLCPLLGLINEFDGHGQISV